MNKRYCKGGLVQSNNKFLPGYYNCEDIDDLYRENLPWETIARTLAPEGAVKAICMHVYDSAIVGFINKYDSFCANLDIDGNVKTISINLGPADQYPEGEIPIERIDA